MRHAHAATRLAFFHPDSTVGSGLSPESAVTRHYEDAPLAGSASLPYRRSGLSPCPEGFLALL